MDSAHSIAERVWHVLELAQATPAHVWALVLAAASLVLATLLYAVVFAVAPVPRAPRREEEAFVTVDAHGAVTAPRPLPCWQYRYLARKQLADRTDPAQDKHDLEPADVFLSVVIPAYNEEKRLPAMLEEALAVLNDDFGATHAPGAANGAARHRTTAHGNGNGADATAGNRGWEILIVSDGSKDKTEQVALDFARRAPAGSIRVVSLVRNRGKGGAVVHGMRHVRGDYVVFADADGASKFSDVTKLVQAAQRAQDQHGRAVAVGSRAHLVGSEAVVQRSKLRNFLMHSFHLFLWLLTPPATSAIKDTQCGFKLFTRPALPYIIPHMHSEGWIFDVEMLMLAEKAQVPIAEVPIGWREIQGPKLNVVWDSLGMAWGLTILRLAWAVGVYRV